MPHPFHNRFKNFNCNDTLTQFWSKLWQTTFGELHRVMQLIKLVRATNLYFCPKTLAIKNATQPFPLNIVDSTCRFWCIRIRLTRFTYEFFSQLENEIWQQKNPIAMQTVLYAYKFDFVGLPSKMVFVKKIHFYHVQHVEFVRKIVYVH